MLDGYQTIYFIVSSHISTSYSFQRWSFIKQQQQTQHSICQIVRPSHSLHFDPTLVSGEICWSPRKTKQIMVFFFFVLLLKKSAGIKFLDKRTNIFLWRFLFIRFGRFPFLLLLRLNLLVFALVIMSLFFFGRFKTKNTREIYFNGWNILVGGESNGWYEPPAVEIGIMQRLVGTGNVKYKMRDHVITAAFSGISYSVDSFLLPLSSIKFVVKVCPRFYQHLSVSDTCSCPWHRPQQIAIFIDG